MSMWERTKRHAAELATEAYHAAIEAGATEVDAEAAAVKASADYLDGYDDWVYERERDRRDSR